MKTTSLALAIVLVLIGSARLSAHRLDEYLQASRLSIELDRIVVELDLTAGVSVAAGITATIDGDHDGAISPTEAADYASAVLADVSLSVNDARIPIRLTRVEAPTVGEMSEGLGTLRVMAMAQLPTVNGQRLRVRYRNDHRTDVGVFLVNAMVPQIENITLASQDRDLQQREIRLDYNVSPVWRAQVGWLSFAFLLLSSFFCLRQVSSRG